MPRKRKGGKGKYISGPETRLFEFLQAKFPKIQAQVKLYDQRIDMYIPELDMYVQLDGVYWHGLDETLERPNAVIRKMRKDMLLNGFFKGLKSGHKMFRITDLQWSHLEDVNDRDKVIECILAAGPGLTEFDGPPGYRKKK
jgi:hypothetical protein